MNILIDTIDRCLIGLGFYIQMESLEVELDQGEKARLKYFKKRWSIVGVLLDYLCFEVSLFLTCFDHTNWINQLDQDSDGQESFYLAQIRTYPSKL